MKKNPGRKERRKLTHNKPHSNVHCKKYKTRNSLLESLKALGKGYLKKRHLVSKGFLSLPETAIT